MRLCSAPIESKCNALGDCVLALFNSASFVDVVSKRMAVSARRFLSQPLVKHKRLEFQGAFVDASKLRDSSGKEQFI